jgi:adiponectin receptor
MNRRNDLSLERVQSSVSDASAVSVDQLDVYGETSPGGTRHLRAVIADEEDQKAVQDAIEQSQAESPILPRKRAVKLHAHTVHYHEAPDYCKGNTYLVKGYRVELTFADCLRSAFSRNNERSNIWSHAIGFLIFFLLLILVWTPALPWPKGASVEHDPHHRVMFTLFCACVALCCWNSTVYHTFGVLSGKMAFRLLQADYLGIIAQIGGSIMLVIYYAFYCNKDFQILYLTMNAVFSSIGIFATTRKVFFTNEARAMRATVFFLIAASSLVPVFHLFAVVPYAMISHHGLDWPFYCMVSVYLLGIFFFVTCIPERFRPGHFDCCVPSHSYMHICTVVAAGFHFYGCWHLMTYLADRDGFTCRDSYW